MTYYNYLRIIFAVSGNISYSIFIFLGISTDRKEEQSQNAPIPISVTLSGITIDCKEEQPLKAKPSILVTPSGITIDCKEEQP